MFNRSKKKMPDISVVVPAYNAESTIKKCLSSIAKQRYPFFEVIVVDDASTDDTAAIAKSFGKVTLIQQKENKGSAAARNKGIKAAKSELIAFLDADCYAVKKNWLRELVKTLVEEKADFVTGEEQFTSHNFAGKKSALLKLGLFDESFTTGGEDKELWLRIYNSKHKLKCNKNAFIPNNNAVEEKQSLLHYLRKQFKNARGDSLLFFKNSNKFIKGAVPKPLSRFFFLAFAFFFLEIILIAALLLINYIYLITFIFIYLLFAFSFFAISKNRQSAIKYLFLFRPIHSLFFVSWLVKRTFSFD